MPQDQVINKWTNMSPLVLTRGSAASSRYHKIYTIHTHTFIGIKFDILLMTADKLAETVEQCDFLAKQFTAL